MRKNYMYRTEGIRDTLQEFQDDAAVYPKSWSIYMHLKLS